jgi:hypothetical protein
MRNDRSLDEELRQNKVKTEETRAGDTTAAVEFPVCACAEDVLAELFPDLKTGSASSRGGLLQFVCPGCGRAYLTNAMNDLCLDCQEKGVQVPETGVTLES